MERGRGRHYSAALRARVTAWARHRLEVGATIQGVAAELAMHRETLRRWLRVKHTTEALVPVEVVEDIASTSGLRVVSPSGFRIDGLTLDEAIAVLRRLA